MSNNNIYDLIGTLITSPDQEVVIPIYINDPIIFQDFKTVARCLRASAINRGIAYDL